MKLQMAVEQIKTHCPFVRWAAEGEYPKVYDVYGVCASNTLLTSLWDDMSHEKQEKYLAKVIKTLNGHWDLMKNAVKGKKGG